MPMARRAQFQFGAMLPRGPRGQVDAGLGKGIARGTPGLIAPTQSIVQPVEEHTIDGVEIIFQLAPETEAPAEMHMFYPQLRRAQHGGERLSAAAQLHPAARRRGARSAHLGQVHRRRHRDCTRPKTDVLIGQHHWPMWGRDACSTISKRSATSTSTSTTRRLRLMNKGWRPAEIAEALDLPPGLAERWTVRGYYGTRQPQREGGLPALSRLVRRQPVQSPSAAAARRRAKKFVEYMGGAAAVIARAKADFAKGEYRWVAQVMREVVFAEPANIEARALVRRRAGADGLPGRSRRPGATPSCTARRNCATASSRCRRGSAWAPTPWPGSPATCSST